MLGDRRGKERIGVEKNGLDTLNLERSKGMAKVTVKKQAVEASGIEDKIVVRHRSFLVHIKGQAPLLFNKMPDMSKGAGEKVIQQKVDSVEAERLNWRKKLHFRADIGVYLPGRNFKMNWASGAQYWGQKIPGSMKTYTDLIRSASLIEDAPLGIMEETDPRIEEYGTHCTGNVSKGSRGGKVYKIRPLIREWACVVPIHVYDDRLTEGVLKTCITFAGMYKGMGDYRPEYGRYALIKLEEVDSVVYE